MNLHRADGAHRRQVHVVIYWAAAGVKHGYAGHLVVGEREVKNVEVLPHALPAHRLGYNHYAALIEPAQYHLPRGLAVLSGYGLERRVAEYVALTLGKRRPGLMLYALAAQKGIGLALLEKRMSLKLVDCGLHLIMQKRGPAGARSKSLSHRWLLSAPPCKVSPWHATRHNSFRKVCV